MSADDWTSGGVKRDGADAGPGFPDDRERFEAGDTEALLWVIMICAQTNWRMPEWARDALYELYWSGAYGKIKSWDDIFGKPWGHGQRRAAITWHKQWDVRRRVKQLHEKEGAPIDNELFERVGKEFGLSRATASTLYYSVQRRFKREEEKL